MSDSIGFFVENNISASGIGTNVTTHRHAHMVAHLRSPLATAHTSRYTVRHGTQIPAGLHPSGGSSGCLRRARGARNRTCTHVIACASAHIRPSGPVGTSDGGSAAATSDDRSAVTSNGGSAAAAAVSHGDGSRACTASTACERTTRRSHASDARRERGRKPCIQWVCMANGGRGASSSADNVPGSVGSAGS